MLQLFDNKYPYTDFHELNLDWIISRIIQMDHKLSNFVSLNTIKYADPIAWDITTQYATNTIVIDPATGVAYISTQPVPVGVPITDTDYWTVVFDLTPLINMFTGIRDQISFNYEDSYTSTHNYSVGDWLFVHDSVTGKDLLYIVTSPVTINGGIIPNFNVRKVTVEELVSEVIDSVEDLQVLFEGIREQISVNYEDSYTSTHNYSVGDWLFIHDSVTGKDLLYEVILPVSINDMLVSGTNISKVTIEDLVGNLHALTTVNRGNIVSAINEINGKIGDLNDLTTSDKSSVVNAINEANIDKTYINVLDYGAKGDGVTDDTAAIDAAIAAAGNFKNIFFPSGRYITRGHVIPTSTGVIGSGVQSQIIDIDNTSPTFDYSSLNLSQLTFKDISIYRQTEPETTDTSAIGINLRSTSNGQNLQFDNIALYNHYTGISARALIAGATMRNCISYKAISMGFFFTSIWYVYNCFSAHADYAAFRVAGIDRVVSGFYFNNCTAYRSQGTGFMIDGTSNSVNDVMLLGCIAGSTRKGAYGFYGSGINHQIVSCYSEYPGYGEEGRTDPWVTAEASGINISGHNRIIISNFFEFEGAYAGIRVANATDVRISDSFMQGNKYGIYFDHVTKLDVHHCSLDGFNLGDAGIAEGNALGSNSEVTFESCDLRHNNYPAYLIDDVPYMKDCKGYTYSLTTPALTSGTTYTNDTPIDIQVELYGTYAGLAVDGYAVTWATGHVSFVLRKGHYFKPVFTDSSCKMSWIPF